MSILERLKDFFKDHQYKLIISIGFILACIISFSAGRLTVISQSKPIEIDESKIFDKGGGNKPKEGPEEELVTENNSNDTEKSNTEENEGVFVGNIENNKFYPFNSEEVGDISTDNRMWFDSQEEAEEQGYILANNNTINTAKSTGNEDGLEEITEDCKYVGSKNSDKYHMPDSGPAKRIKEENKVCFKSKKDAENKGYEAGSSVKD